MRALIVDDELKSRELMKALIQDFCKNVEIVAEAIDVKDALKAISKYDPDLVFLDIEMPEEDGFVLLEHYDGNLPFEVIFTTAYDEFALRAFDFSATDYLLKPINVERLQQSIEKVRTKKNSLQNGELLKLLKGNLSKELPETIALPIENGYTIVKVKDIVLCKAEGAYTNVFIKDDKVYMSSRGLSKFQELLQDSDFLRVHRSYLVNLLEVTQYIRGKNPLLVLSNGDKVEVSSTKKEILLQHLRRV